MREQRWKGDNQTIDEQFRSSLKQERMGMAGQNADLGHDYLALGTTRHLDAYQMGGLEDSWCTQLDTVGMQPHSREYLERDVLGMKSRYAFETIDGQTIDHCDGIQFSGSP